VAAGAAPELGGRKVLDKRRVDAHRLNARNRSAGIIA
jgi:hypothetical protein